MFLEESTMRRPECKHYHEVAKAFQDFELNKLKWYDIGGRVLIVEEESNIFMGFFPKSLKEKSTYDHLDAFHIQQDKLNTWLKGVVKTSHVWTTGDHKVNSSYEAWDEECYDADIGELYQQEVMNVMNRDLGRRRRIFLLLLVLFVVHGVRVRLWVATRAKGRVDLPGIHGHGAAARVGRATRDRARVRVRDV